MSHSANQTYRRGVKWFPEANVSATSASGRYRRHELEVTIDRLHSHLDRYFEHLSGAERDDISRVVLAFERIQEAVS